jgi:hypothetical protein
MSKLKIIVAISASVLAAASAPAAITVYTSQSAFLAAVGTPGVDTFETLSITSTTQSPITRTAGSYGYTASVSTTSFFGAGTNADHWLSTNTATDTITFGAFTGGVSALGGFFFGSDINGAFASGSVTLTATDASGTVLQTITGANQGSFLGFVSDGALSLATLSAAQAGSTVLWPTANNLTLAGAATAPAAVPEPATWAMFIGGFGLIGSTMRRRQRTTVRFA